MTDHEEPGAAVQAAPGAITSEQLAQFAAEWRRKAATGHPRLLTPLPRRVRLRLAVTHAINVTAIWLVDRRQTWLAKWLWGACRMLRR